MMGYQPMIGARLMLQRRPNGFLSGLSSSALGLGFNFFLPRDLELVSSTSTSTSPRLIQSYSTARLTAYQIKSVIIQPGLTSITYQRPLPQGPTIVEILWALFVLRLRAERTG